MSTPTDEKRDLLTVVVSMRAAEGKTEELRAALEALIEPTRQEEGCVDYDLHQGFDDPRVFIYYENWLSSEHHDAHFAAPHQAGILRKVGELLDESGFTLHRVRRIA